MKALTISALIGALVAIPFMFRRRIPQVEPVKIKYGTRLRQLDENIRYDVDDFLTE